jgi:STE24 endopeptidase
MGDTLLDEFSPDEIEVIFAHEIGHHVFHHIRKLIVTGVLTSIVGFWICDRVLLAWAQAQYGPLDAHHLPTSTLPLLMLVLTVFGLLFEPLQNIVSRRYERQCDRYALARTGLRAAYISAFRKLARLNKDDPNPPALEVFLFHSHPPISERLALADE